MLKSSARSAIRLRGVRHNNLKNFDLDLPLNRLVVVTGLSGSGKSSLAFDTLFAEGQRRYIETFSPYARQFLDRMDKPQVDSIEGIPPAIAIEQRNAVKTTRSTVGTMTEICDHMKLVWPQLARLHCRQCGNPVRKEPPQTIWESLTAGTKEPAGNGAQAAREILITFDLPLTEKLSLQECLALVAKQGYQRLVLGDRVVRLEAMAERPPALETLTVVQDRLELTRANRARFVEACEQAYHFGKGKLAIREFRSSVAGAAQWFSNRLHCAPCDIDYREPSPALFSFNHPLGACPACRGFGRVISIDYNLALPDHSRTLAEGVVRPWQTGFGLECQEDLLRTCRRHNIPTDVPFNELPQKWQDFVIEGEPGYGTDAAHEWPRAWYGIKGYFRWLESRAYKMHVRVLLSRYRAYTPCPECQGARFKPESLLYRIKLQNSSADGLTLADFYRLPIRDALKLIDRLASGRRSTAQDPIGLVLGEIRARLGYLEEVGLGYLTLDRPTRSLSGGETERVSLTTSLGTRLVNTLFVLDEPSVGLHPRDTRRLIRILEQLRDAENTVVVVEHEASIIRAADQIVDLGPGHGATGGQVVFQGSFPEILKSRVSLTGDYLSGRRTITVPPRRDSGSAPWLKIAHANRHNLQDLTVEIPLGRLVCITGVSGSGKTTLVREVLLPAVQERLQPKAPAVKASERLGEEKSDTDEETTEANGPAYATVQGWETLGRVLLVDQSLLGKTPRSNPAVYIGAFDDIREFFAQSDLARRRGLNASAFSFNSAQGQCERCRGAGFEKIEMQFLSDIFIRCPDCNGRRYRAHILEIKVQPGQNGGTAVQRSMSIADLLEASVEEAIAFLAAFPESKPASRAVKSLQWLVEVGLGYLSLGQPINTLSGGESQRLKLVRHLADAFGSEGQGTEAHGNQASASPGSTLFLFDEPTTGLHFDDVRILLQVFEKLVDRGHSVLVIEHNLDVIKSADWVIDLGPDAGDGGGQIVAQGTPETIARCASSHTGQALKEVLPTPGNGRQNGNSRSPRPAARRRRSGRPIAVLKG